MEQDCKFWFAINFTILQTSSVPTKSNLTIISSIETETPPVLQKAQINIKDGLFCSEGIIAKHNYKGLKAEQICGGDSSVISDTCRGDSGGPLIQTLENGWKTIVGLTSFGPAFCNSNNIPGIYTRVSSFIQWIRAEVEKDFGIKNSVLKRSMGRKRPLNLYGYRYWDVKE